MDLNELKQKYNIKPRPKYHDARHIKTFISLTPKGQYLFELDIDGKHCTLTTSLPFVGKRPDGNITFTTRSFDVLDGFLGTLDLAFVEDTVLSDDEVIKRLGKQLGYKLKPVHFQSFAYIKWDKSIQLDDPFAHNLPYNQFYEGVGHEDDNYSLGYLMMTLDDFEAWLIKMGVTKGKKPKAIRSASYYD